MTIGQLCWTRDDALLAVEPTYTFADQLWLIPARGHEASQVTNDSNSYTGVSASADGRRLVTTQFTRASNIYVAPGGEIERGVKIALVRFGAELPTEAAKSPARVIGDLPSRDRALMQWTPDSKALVFSVTQNGVANLWRQPIDGGPARQITNFTEGRIPNFA